MLKKTKYLKKEDLVSINHNNKNSKRFKINKISQTIQPMIMKNNNKLKLKLMNKFLLKKIKLSMTLLKS